MSAKRPEPGTLMIFRWRKWDGSPHWANEEVYLGSDRWGDWLGQPSGWRSVRPGREFIAVSPDVTLIPHADAAHGADHAVTVHRDHPKGMRVYIDLAWNVRWTDGGTDAATGWPVLATGIDMDLDVVRVAGERGTWVDDRDEWAEHSIRYGYPPETVAHLESLAVDLERRVRAQVPPFDDVTADAWLDRLEALRPAR
ncbi:hypothetical protein [Microbacterium soli]|uniref:DUF402 domain-containing protein n=1 Tax=Microbacterium soli TaxID=446075 RepID=A0ABP7N9Q8_9MICO